MGDELNVPLLVLDYIVILPITILRLFIIYIYGSRYNVSGLEILDVMMHAKDPKFNNGKTEVDVKDKNISNVIHDMINPVKSVPKSINDTKHVKKQSNKSSNKINKELHKLEKSSKKYIDSDTIYDLIKTVDDDNHRSKRKSKAHIDNHLTKLTHMISNIENTKQNKKNKPKIEKISIIKDSESSGKSKKQSNFTQISSLNIPELINTSSESDNENNESSFAITFTDDNK